MKYIEELKAGDAFVFHDQYFILTSDFKKDGSKLAFSLSDGYPKWYKSDQIVNYITLFTTNQENQIIPIKETPKHEFSV